MVANYYYNRGIALQATKQIRRCNKDLSTTLVLNPEFFEANINRAVALLEKGDLDGAIADYSRALQYKTDDVAIYYGRGSASQKKKDLQGALTDYTKAIQIDPKHALAYANRAVVKVLLKKPDASADFETAFRLDPSLRTSYREFYEKRRKP